MKIVHRVVYRMILDNYWTNDIKHSILLRNLGNILVVEYGMHATNQSHLLTMVWFTESLVYDSNNIKEHKKG